LQGSRSGPLRRDALLELCLGTANTPAKRSKASELGATLANSEDAASEYYDSHALDQLLLARLQATAGNSDLALKSWEKACNFLAAYGWRKDITIFEVLDPIPALASINADRGRSLLRAIQPSIERVLVHTDGKDTRHSFRQWINTAARICPANAL